MTPLIAIILPIMQLNQQSELSFSIQHSKFLKTNNSLNMHTDKCRYMRGISLVVEQVVAKFPHKFCKNDQIGVRFPDTALPRWHNGTALAWRARPLQASRFDSWSGRVFRKNKNV